MKNQLIDDFTRELYAMSNKKSFLIFHIKKNPPKSEGDYYCMKNKP
jgi:hypothetical protein